MPTKDREAQPSKRFAFGDFELDLERREMCRRGIEVHLEPKALELLSYLIRHRARVVPKGELLDQMWPGQAVSEGVLSQAVWVVRRATRDDGRSQRVIRTYPRRGYRFVAALREVHWTSSPTAAADRSVRDSGFLGRDAELAELEAMLESGERGHGKVVLIEGDAGVGKTRLLDEIAARARARGATVLAARCREEPGAPPLWPWQAIVRGAVAALEGAAASPSEYPVEARWPESSGADPLAHEPARARFEFFEEVAALLRAAGDQNPVVIAMDDLHWADSSGLALLRHVGRSLSPRRANVVLVAAHRSGALKEGIAAVYRESAFHHVVLRGLSVPEVGMLVKAMVGGHAENEIVEQIHATTEGNPFFVQEIVRSAAGPVRSSFVLPERVREVVLYRVTARSAECRRLLDVAAVIGREFDLDATVRAIGLERPVVLAGIDEAVSAQLIELDPAHTKGRFVHALIREVLYQELRPTERVALHGAVAESLEGTGFAEHRLEELAHHHYEAALGGDPSRALFYAVAAARAATRMLAFDEAVRHYDRAIRLSERGSPVDLKVRCELMIARGRALWGTRAKVETVRSEFLDAAQLAREVADPSLLAAAAIGYTGAQAPAPLVPELRAVDRVKVDLLEEAVSSLGDEDTRQTATLLGLLAVALRPCGVWERSDELTQRSIELARVADDPSVLAQALLTRSSVLVHPTRTKERLATASEAVEAAREGGARVQELYAHFYRAVPLLELGEFSMAEAEMASMQQISRDLRRPGDQIWGLLFRIMRQVAAGAFETAERSCEAVVRLGDETRFDARSLQAGILATIRVLRGRFEETLPFVEQFAAEHHADASVQGLVAMLHTELGHEDAARRVLAPLAAGGFQSVPLDERWLNTMTSVARACASLGDEVLAAELYDLLRPFEHQIAMSNILLCFGSVSQLLGLLAGTLDRIDQAEHHFRAAASANARIGATALVTLTEADHARLLFQRGGPARRDRAEALRSRALRQAERLGLGLATRRLSRATLAQARP